MRQSHDRPPPDDSREVEHSTASDPADHDLIAAVREAKRAGFEITGVTVADDDADERISITYRTADMPDGIAAAAYGATGLREAIDELARTREIESRMTALSAPQRRAARAYLDTHGDVGIDVEQMAARQDCARRPARNALAPRITSVRGPRARGAGRPAARRTRSAASSSSDDSSGEPGEPPPVRLRGARRGSSTRSALLTAAYRLAGIVRGLA